MKKLLLALLITSSALASNSTSIIQQTKLGINQQVFGTGLVTGSPFVISGANHMKVVVEGVGGGNVIVVKGRIRDQAAYSTIATITGTSSGTDVDISLYDQVTFDCTTFSASGTPKLVVSSFFKQAVGGGGTVTSVGLALPGIFSVSGSPVTTSGTLTGTFVNQTANTVFAGPASGSPAVPTFRVLTASDIPSLSGLYVLRAGDSGLGTMSWGSDVAATPTLNISSDAVGSLDVIPYAERMAYNHAGTKIAMQADKNGNRLWVYDVAGQTFSTPVTLSAALRTFDVANPIKWSDDDSKIYVIENEKVEEFPVNLSSSTIHSFPGETELSDLLFVDAFAYLASYNVGVHQIDLSDWSVDQTATTHVTQCFQLAVSPDHTTLYPACADGAGNTFAPYAIPALTEITTVTLNHNIDTVAPTPDGTWVLVGTDEPKIYKLQVSDFSVATSASVAISGTIYAPNNTSVYVFGFGQLNVYKYNVSDLSLNSAITVTSGNGLVNYGVSSNGTQFLIPLEVNAGSPAKIYVNQPSDDGTGAVVQAVGDFNIPIGFSYKIGGVPTLANPLSGDLDFDGHNALRVGNLQTNGVNSVEVGNRQLINQNGTTMCSWNDTSTDPYFFCNFLSSQNERINGSIDSGLTGVLSVAASAHQSNSVALPGAQTNAQYCVAMSSGGNCENGDSLANMGHTFAPGMASGYNSENHGYDTHVFGDFSKSLAGSDNSFTVGSYGISTTHNQFTIGNGYFDTQGDAMNFIIPYRGALNGGGSLELTTDGSSSTFQPPVSSTLGCEIDFTAKSQEAGTNLWAMFVRRFIANTDSGGSISISNLQTIGADMGSNAGAPPSDWSVDVVASSSIAPQVTDAGGDNSRWVARMTCSQVVFP